jgi:hypothetical protein
MLPSVTVDEVRAAYEANAAVRAEVSWDEVLNFSPLYRALEIEAAISIGARKK